jgi:hypothetical protein
MNKTILILAHNRNKILIENLKSLKKNKYYNKYKKVLVLQSAKEEIINKVKVIDRNIKVIKTMYTSDHTIYSKVNNNIMLGLDYCFNKLSSEYVIFLEDDIRTGYDYLYFCDYIIKKYKYNKNFFGVNGFSKEKGEGNKFSYSKFIFGVGKGWAIPKKNFFYIRKFLKQILSPNIERFFDVHLEFFIKSNFFVIMPYRSRTLEIASDGITFKEEFKHSKFYKDWKKSFIGTKCFPIKKYNYINNLEFSWRNDCLNFNSINKFKSVYLHLIRKIYFFLKKIYKKNEKK